MGEAGKAASEHRQRAHRRCVSAERRRQRSPASSRRDSPSVAGTDPSATMRALSGTRSVPLSTSSRS
jgi:hypothetical protein